MQKITIRDYTSDSYVVVEGEISDGTFFIIQSGSVILFRKSSNQNMTQVCIGEGEFFEVESGMTGRPRIFSAIAKTDCKIIVVPKVLYDDLIQKKPALVQKIILGFSQKMRELDVLLAKVSTTIKKPEQKSDVDEKHLIEVGDFYKGDGQYYPALFAYNNFLKQAVDSKLVPDVKEKIQGVKDESSISEEEYNKCVNTESSKPLLNISKGNMIFAETMLGDAMYFIQKGCVKICKIVDNKEVSLALLHRGEFFGEMALLENKPRSASAVVVEDATLLVIKHENFPVIIERQPNLITRITTVLADRIWFLYRQITNFLLPIGETRIYDALVLFMEKNGVDITKKKPESLSLTAYQFLENTGMKSNEGKLLLQSLMNSEVVFERENILYVTSPMFTYNRSMHLHAHGVRQNQKSL